MPLDLSVIRENVNWDRAASAALREGVEALEDQLLSLGYDDLELAVEVRRLPGALASVQAELRLPLEPVARHGEDADLPMLLRRLLGELADEATTERLARGGMSQPLIADDGDVWTTLTPRLAAIASREVRHAVEFGDLPAGMVEPNELVDQAVVEALGRGEDAEPSLRDLARRVRTLLAERIQASEDGATDVFLDERVQTTNVAEAMTQDEFYDYRVEDETPLRESDVMGEFASIDGRVSVDEPTEPG